MTKPWTRRYKRDPWNNPETKLELFIAPDLKLRLKNMKNPKIQKRNKGQTVVYDTWEWLYAPTEIRPETWKQLKQLCLKGAKIRVIQWPQGVDVFRNGQYLDMPDKYLTDEAQAIREEEPL